MNFKRFPVFPIVFIILAVVAAPYTWAASVEDMVTNLQKQMGDMQRTIQMQNQKIQQLESKPVASGGAAMDVPPPMSEYEFNDRLNNSLGGANKWLKDLKFSADVRLRYEAFAYKSSAPNANDPRNRFRYRLRFGFEKPFLGDMRVGFFLASGSTTDPTSTNETLDNDFTFKTVVIERVYAIYEPSWAKIGPVKSLQIGAGKWQNPFERGSSDMIWDRDVRPEGAYEMIDLQLFKNEDVDLTSYFLAGQMVLDEDSRSNRDANLFAFQGGLNAVVYTPFMQRPVDALSAVSFYSFDNYAYDSNFIANGTNFARGNVINPSNATELAAKNFNVLESYTEIAFYPWGVPVRPFFDIAYNTDDQSPGTGGFLNDANLAWALGGKLGSIVKKGDWELYYAYKYINNNAVVGAFPDSDFSGDANHVGKKGNVFKAAYAITDNLQLNGAIFLVDNLHSTTTANIGQGLGNIQKSQQFRSQVDLLWKF